MTETIITQLTLETLRQAFQEAGYRVEELNDPVADLSYLRSATGGMPFEIRPGNRLQSATDAYAYLDANLIAAFQVQGELPLEIVNRWNATRRFGRLQLSPPFLVLSFDVSVAGGVTPRYLRTQLELWDHLIQQLVGYLREELQKLGTAARASAVAAQAPQPNAEEDPEARAQHPIPGTVQ